MKKLKTILGVVSVLLLASPTVASASVTPKAHATYISSVNKSTTTSRGESVVMSMNSTMSAQVSSEIKMGSTRLDYATSRSYQGLYPAKTYAGVGASSTVKNGLNAGGWEYFYTSTSVSF